MTTAQTAPNGHHGFPPPFRVESPSEANPPDLPTDKAHTNSDIATASAVPESHVAQPTNDVAEPEKAAPSARQESRGVLERGTASFRPEEVLPERCQFFFSDGRQCTMARSDIHPSLCTYHSEREEQLFGAPGPLVRGPSFDLPELYSACRDLSTAAGVNRALAQVFRLLALRRISRQEAATFGHLARLLLRTISLMNAEAMIQSEESLRGPLTPEEVLPHSSRSRTPTQPSPEAVIPKTSSPISAPTLADCGEIGRSGENEESRRGNGVQQGPASKRFVPGAPSAAISSQRMNTSAPSACNSAEISTCKNAEVQPVQNEHLHKMHSEGGSCSSGRPPKPGSHLTIGRRHVIAYDQEPEAEV